MYALERLSSIFTASFGFEEVYVRLMIVLFFSNSTWRSAFSRKTAFEILSSSLGWIPMYDSIDLCFCSPFAITVCFKTSSLSMSSISEFNSSSPTSSLTCIGSLRCEVTTGSTRSRLTRILVTA